MNGETGGIQPGTLDRYWRSNGAAELRQRFVGTVNADRNKAVKLLQDETNTFPVIYILAGDIESGGLTDELPNKCKEALYIVAAKNGDKARAGKFAEALGDNGAPSREALVWMVTTGADWDGPSSGPDEYDASIDAAVAFLADGYDEPEAMKAAAELLYRRNRRGMNVHDLAWGFYKTADPNALSYMAKHLTGDNEMDVDLTCKLMGFDDPGTKDGRRKLFEEYSGWLSEHRPYLYATEEHFNSTSKPYSIRHDREAKFLQREIEPRSRAPKKPLSAGELQVLYAHRASGGERAGELGARHAAEHAGELTGARHAVYEKETENDNS